MKGKFEIKLDSVPIHPDTLKGAHLNNDDLQILCRVLSLWGNAYEEQFEEMMTEIRELRKEVNELRITIDCTRHEVDDIKKDVEMLKRKNTVIAYIIRGAITVAGAIGIARYIHGPFQ